MTYRRDPSGMRTSTAGPTEQEQFSNPSLRRLGSPAIQPPGPAPAPASRTPAHAARTSWPATTTTTAANTQVVGGVPAPTPHTATASTGATILVKSGLKQVAVRLGEIMFVEAARNYVRIHTDAGLAIKTRVPIDRLAEHLGQVRFLRVHRGRIVNVDRVRGVTPLAGGRLSLVLSNGARVAVARDRRRAVLADLSRHPTREQTAVR